MTANGTAASEGGSSSYNTSGGFTIQRTDYSEEKTKTQSGLASSTLTVASATLAGNTCGTFGSPSAISGSPAQSEPSGCYRYTLTGTDNAGNSASVTTTVKVDTTPPSTPALAFSGLSGNTYYNASTNTLYFRPASGGAFAVSASSADADIGILGGHVQLAVGQRLLRNAHRRAGGVRVRGGRHPSRGARLLCRQPTMRAPARPMRRTPSCPTPGAPTGGALSVNGTAASAAGSSSFNTTGSFAIGTRTEYGADAGSGVASSVLTRATGTLSANACGGYGTPTTIAGNPSQSGLAEGCYLYTLTGTDRVGNAASVSSTVKVDKTAPAAKVSVPADANGSVAVTFSATYAGSGVNAAKGQLKRAVATYTPASDSCGTYAAYANIGPARSSTSPYTDTTVTSGHCYEYQYTVSDNAGNSSTSAASAVKINTAKPALVGIADTTAGSTAGLPQVGDAITLTFSDPIASSSIPSALAILYTRTGTITATQLGVGGLSNGNWSAGYTLFTPHYTKTGGTSPLVTVSSSVSGVTVKLTVTKIADSSGNLTAGGPGAVSGTLNSSIKDVFGNTASTSSFTTPSVKLDLSAREKRHGRDVFGVMSTQTLTLGLSERPAPPHAADAPLARSRRARGHRRHRHRQSPRGHGDVAGHVRDGGGVGDPGGPLLGRFGTNARTDGFFVAFALYSTFGVFSQSCG